MKIQRLNILSRKIIGCAMDVHRNLGPGFTESIYEKALFMELESKQIHAECQVRIPIHYKGFYLGEHQINLIVQNEIIVTIKAISKVEPEHRAQIHSYLKIWNKNLGLLINFNVPVLSEGISRIHR